MNLNNRLIKGTEIECLEKLNLIKDTQPVKSLLKKSPNLTRIELAEKTGVTPDGIKQHIAKLKRNGLLERIGGRKDGYWKVIDE